MCALQIETNVANNTKTVMSMMYKTEALCHVSVC